MKAVCYVLVVDLDGLQVSLGTSASQSSVLKQLSELEQGMHAIWGCWFEVAL